MKMSELRRRVEAAPTPTRMVVMADEARVLLAVVDAAREWVRVYDAPQKTNVEWANAMQRLRIALPDLGS